MRGSFALLAFVALLPTSSPQLLPADELEAVEQKPYRPSGHIEVKYRKAYEDYARALRSEFPLVTFQGETFHPGDGKMYLAQLLQMVFFGGLAISLIGRSLLPEPASKFLEANQLPVLGGCFLCNILAGNLLNTGAFEVTYNDQFVWSKIEAERFPQMDELRAALAAVGVTNTPP